MCTASEGQMNIQANLSLCLTHMMYLWFYRDQTLLKIESLFYPFVKFLFLSGFGLIGANDKRFNLGNESSVRVYVQFIKLSHHG